jgi:superfamily II DNA/RNA helicase
MKSTKPRTRDNEVGDVGFKPREDRGKKKERNIRPPINDDEESLFHTKPTGIKKQAEIKVVVLGEDSNTIKKIESFQEPGFSVVLLENITRSKYDTPTPVQKFAIPIILKRRDLVACAQTGSGKTAAYILPILANILQDGIQSGEFDAIQTPQALILATTRELAIDIVTECRKFSFNCNIKINILYGGTVLEKGTNILVATPCALTTIINRSEISLEKVKYIVLDEADRMFDTCFEAPVREILGKCSLNNEERSMFFFSDTFPTEIQKLAQDFLTNFLFLNVGIVGGTNTDVEQAFPKTTHFEKRNKGCFKPRKAPGDLYLRESGENGGKEVEEKKERNIRPPINDDEESLFHTKPTGIKKQAEIKVVVLGEDSNTIKKIESFQEPGWKTAAYILPILANILQDGIQSGEFDAIQTPQALILATTRELAIDIVTECRKFSFNCNIKINILYGGTVPGFRLIELAKGTNILVATPCALTTVINRGEISLEKVKYIVLDVADRMLDTCFEAPVPEIIGKCLNNEECSIFFVVIHFQQKYKNCLKISLINTSIHLSIHRYIYH